MSLEFLVKYFYISVPVLAGEEMPSFSVMIANAAAVQHLSRDRHSVRCYKSLLSEKLPRRGRVKSGKKFGFGVRASVFLSRAYDKKSRRDQSEKEALVIRLFILYI